MKKLLGILVLGFLLNGCASQETKQLHRTSYYAGAELVKKGINPFFRAYGPTRETAIKKAMGLCEIKKQEIGTGYCRVYHNCTWSPFLATKEKPRRPRRLSLL